MVSVSKKQIIFGVTMEPSSNRICTFCRIGAEEHGKTFFAKFTHCYVIRDKYPASTGHMLIIPFKHTHTQRRFQFSQLRTQRRLRDVAVFRCFAKAQQIGNGDQVLELT